ncbi:UNVERIFIED_CONTAM: hypothetical protein K2H54_031743 [Gekko kuhli]
MAGSNQPKRPLTIKNNVDCSQEYGASSFNSTLNLCWQSNIKHSLCHNWKITLTLQSSQGLSSPKTLFLLSQQLKQNCVFSHSMTSVRNLLWEKARERDVLIFEPLSCYT